MHSCLSDIVYSWPGPIGIGEADWEFATTFDLSDEEFNASNADLVFDGLDTFATVTLVRVNLLNTKKRR